MRKFNFDIDDWTGGQTLSSGMGDVVGSTVHTRKYNYTLTTYPTDTITLTVYPYTTVYISWGDGHSDEILPDGYTIGTSVKHDYEDGKKQERIISVHIEDKEINNTNGSYGTIDYFSNNIKNTSYVPIKKYEVLKGFDGKLYGFFNYSNYTDYLLDIKISSDINEITAYGLNIKSGVGTLIIPDSVNLISCLAIDSLVIHDKIELPKRATVMLGGLGDMTSTLHNNKEIELTVPISKVLRDNSFSCISGFKMVIPEGIEIIGKAAFNFNKSNSPLVLPNSLREIREESFMFSNYTGGLTIPDNVNSIGARAFENATFTNNLILGKGLETIGDSAFNSSSFGGTLVIPSNIKNIGTKAFYKYRNEIRKFTLEEGVERIGKSAFANCKFLKPTIITIPRSVKHIDNMAFGKCNNLYKILIPRHIIDYEQIIHEDDKTKIELY